MTALTEKDLLGYIERAKESLEAGKVGLASTILARAIERSKAVKTA